MGNPSIAQAPAHIDRHEDLRQRLTLLKPEDTVRGVILNGVMEAVRVLGDETLVRQCLDVVGEKRLVDFFSYPSHKHLQLIYTAAGLLDARYGSFEKALWLMGYHGGKNFLSSTPGKVLLLGQGSFKRLLEAVPTAFSVGGNGLKSEVRWTGPTSAVFILDRDFIPPAYTEGTLQSLEISKVKGLRVRWRPTETLVGEYELTWE
ncbi:TIGR02265 family protein [Archangium sp.]|jgi:uncharacterized protein (TIGR02265 family)|uniref:TIGR02265 family protein n=1 Tax=Archangium sp. TaxID=1872627 RepID=UPI002EDA1423